MKRSILLALAGILCIQWFLVSCNKENAVAVVKPKPDPCINTSSKGRIIGFDPSMSFLNFDTARFIKYDSTLGPGYIIEIDNGATKDTSLTYRISTTLFKFQPSTYNIGSLYLFKKEYQDSLKVKFNCRFALDNEKTEVFYASATNDPVLYIWPNFSKNKKEIVVSCVSLQ